LVTASRRAGLALGSLAAGASYFFVVRPWHLRWGATDEEIARPMPWDEHVSQPTYVTNRAITVDAPPAAVWPWLAQLGELPRAGFYSYDWIERLMGMKVASSERILPEQQWLAQGQAIDRAGTMLVRAVEPGSFLVLGPPDGLPELATTWTLALYPLEPGRTRLVSRVRAWIALTARGIGLLLVLDPGQFLMERKMLLGIKGRAERLAG
jgi:hypothetical protein